MQVFFGIAYFLIGLVQLFAIVDGISYGLGIGRFLSFIAAIFITYIPIVGSIIGVYGAVEVWDWSMLQSLVLFFWYIPVFAIIYIVGAIANR